MTPLQLAGAESDAVSLSLPAATVITTPWASATLIPSCNACAQGVAPPRLMLMTRAGVGFGGAPATATPAAHRTPAVMSSNVPPHLPSTRTGRILAFQLRPAIPAPLLVLAAMMPLTNVPCHELASPGTPSPHSPSEVPSPGSDALLSRPSPSFADAGSLMKS